MFYVGHFSNDDFRGHIDLLCLPILGFTLLLKLFYLILRPSFQLLLVESAVRLLMPLPIALEIREIFPLAFVFGPFCEGSFGIVFPLVVLAESEDFPLVFLRVLSLRIDPHLPSNVRFVLLDSDTAYAYHDSDNIMRKNIAFTLLSHQLYVPLQI